MPSSGDLPDPEIEPTSLTSPALAGGFFFFFFLPLELPGKPFLPILPQANPLMYLNLRVPHLPCQPHRTVVMIKET